MKHVLGYLLLLILCVSCFTGTTTDKYQGKRKNIVDVNSKVKEVRVDDVLIGSYARLFVMGDYLIIGDYKSSDYLIRIFDKHTFRYLTSVAHIGQGPEEITVMGHIGIDEKNGTFYVTDHGKMKIFAYELDSVLSHSNYQPKVKAEINMEQFPDRYYYMSDTLSLALTIVPSHSSFEQYVTRWNMADGIFKQMPYEHPDIERKRICMAVSPELNEYVECYLYHDLMTICDLEGNLKFNAYGPAWNSKMSNKVRYYANVVFCRDKIIASYSGNDNFSDDATPTILLVFSKDGDYLKTLDVGRKIMDFCYDKDNNRLIMCLNDEYQFAYLDLNEFF